jgi:hypothetical protein
MVICLLVAALLSSWSAFAMHSLLVGRADGEIVYGALAASCVATVAAAVAVSLTVRYRREWSSAYLASSLGVASFSVVVGIWAWAGA